jgi:hypothetical protein
MKPSEFFLTVTDFFAALVPGATTLWLWVLTGLDPASHVLPVALAPLWLPKDSSPWLLGVGGYFLGHVLSGVGGAVYDPLYDLFYRPCHGLFSIAVAEADHKHSKRDTRWQTWLSAWHEGTLWITRILPTLPEQSCATRTRLLRLLESRGLPASGNTYRAARCYLQTQAPLAFAEVERLEAEQKFWRTSSLGSFLLCALAAGGHLDYKPLGALFAWLCAALGCVFFARYAKIRRKAVAAAYLFFELDFAIKQQPAVAAPQSAAPAVQPAPHVLAPPSE